MPNLHCSTCQLKSIQVLHCLLCVLSLIVCDETVTLGPICPCVLHQLDAVNAAKRLKDPPQHVLGNVEVEAANIKLHRSLFRPRETVSISSNPVLLCGPALLRLAGLNNHRHPAQLLPRETEGQRHRLQVLELDIGNSFEPPRLVAHNQLHIANFAHGGEEILDIPGPHPLAELHAEDGPSVPLLGSKRLFGARRSHIPDVKLAVDISHPAGRTLGGSALLPVSATSASWTSMSRLSLLPLLRRLRRSSRLLLLLPLSRLLLRLFLSRLPLFRRLRRSSLLRDRRPALSRLRFLSRDRERFFSSLIGLLLLLLFLSLSPSSSPPGASFSYGASNIASMSKSPSSPILTF